jgi:CTP synthase (UTP-ammonia lyase)
MHTAVRIGLIGDFNAKQRAHQAIPRSLAAASNGVECVWIATESAGKWELLVDFDGFWCTPGMPYQDPDGVIRAIEFARVNRKPFLGTSAGFQYAILEYARNVLGLSGADHQKSNPNAALPLISPLSCALLGVKARVKFTPGSMLQRVYRTAESYEEYHCSFGLNRRYRRLFEGRDLGIGAVDDQNDVRAIELEEHPFFIATLFQPELRPEGALNPLVAAFVSVCARQARAATRAAG